MNRDACLGFKATSQIKSIFSCPPVLFFLRFVFPSGELGMRITSLEGNTFFFISVSCKQLMLAGQRIWLFTFGSEKKAWRDQSSLAPFFGKEKMISLSAS